MKRYALSTIKGNGTEEDPFSPTVANYPVNWSIAIAPDHQTNPNKKWVLCVVAGTDANVLSIATDSGITLLPVGPEHLPLRWVDVGTTNQRNNLANAIKTRTGVTIARDDPRTFREIMTALGTALDPGFNVNNLDIAE
jgi:hypothetical protein